VRNGELGLVIEVTGVKLVMANREGVRSLFKLTEEFVKVDDSAFALAALAGMRRQKKAAEELAKQASNAKRKATIAAKKAAASQLREPA
jgi:hypothetical protein